MCSSRALLAVFLAIAAAACGRRDPAASDPPVAETESVEIWGLPFTRVFTHENISLLRHDTEGQRVDLTVAREVGPEVARKMIQDKIALFESTFGPARTGYPGQHTRRIEYPERFKPERFERALDCGQLSCFAGYANANFVHGASSDDLAVYRSLYGLLHCPDHRLLVEIDFFAGLDQTERMSRFVAGVSCEID